MSATMSDLKRRLAAAIARQTPTTSDFDLNGAVSLPEGRRLRAAGVLVPIIDGPVPRLVLTKRSSALKHHPGQIAFPGGKVDDTDDGVIAAALREASEEVGLAPDMVDILGTLPPHETVTAFTATPVIGLVDPAFRPVAEEGEVAEVFTVPLSHILDRGNYVIEGRIWQGQVRRYFAVPYGPYYIWGATARMLRGLADRMNDATDSGLADR